MPGGCAVAEREIVARHPKANHQRPDFIAQGYLPGTSTFLLSMSLVNAFLLVLVGLAAIISIMLRVGPFS